MLRIRRFSLRPAVLFAFLLALLSNLLFSIQYASRSGVILCSGGIPASTTSLASVLRPARVSGHGLGSSINSFAVLIGT